MVSLYLGPIRLIDSETLLPLPSLCTFNPKSFASGSAGKSCGFLEVKPRKKKGCYSAVLRMCNHRNLGWDSGGTKDLETEILDFMNNSDNPGMFPTKKDLIRCGRFDLVERIVNQGGWLSMGWDLEEQQEEVTPQDLHTEQLHYSNDATFNPSPSTENQSGIEGILTRLEKERNLSLGISLREKGESYPNASIAVTASEFQKLHTSTSSDGLSDSPTSETWRTWSMRRAGFTDEDFEAAEISSSGSDGVNKDTTNEDLDSSINGKASPSEDINTTHIKSRLQHLQSELSSVLHSLRSHPDEAVTSKDSKINFGNLENVYDDWEFKENEIIYAQNKLRSTRAKLAVLEGKMAMAIIDAQRIVREKQRRIDHASRALRLLRATSIVWPNSASQVLLTGSFDGWSTQRKMKKAENGVFSLLLKLYPGKYEIKFIVDGEWKIDPLRPVVTCNGYENNLLIIS